MTDDTNDTDILEQRRKPRDGIVWTPEQRLSYRDAIEAFDRRNRVRNGIAFALVIAASVVGAALSGKQAGEHGAKAGKAEVERAAKEYAYQFQYSQTKGLRAGCERGNDRIRELNQRAVQHRKTDLAIKIVAKGAREARLHSYATTHEKFDLDAARAYGRAMKLISTIHFATFPIIDCAKAYPYPAKPT